jgi:hypothetical protein
MGTSIHNCTIRPSPAGNVKVATQKIQIFTLATSTVKNTSTIIFIILFISLKYYFPIFFYCFIFFLSLPSPSPTTGQPIKPTAKPVKTTLAHPHPRPITGRWWLVQSMVPCRWCGYKPKNELVSPLHGPIRVDRLVDSAEEAGERSEHLAGGEGEAEKARR